jgi:hypothetical protein
MDVGDRRFSNALSSDGAREVLVEASEGGGSESGVRYPPGVVVRVTNFGFSSGVVMTIPSLYMYFTTWLDGSN